MRDQSVGALAEQLAANAEALCRRYLPGGRREGRYWLAGDVTGQPGRSLYVRLEQSGGKRAGKWSDAATGEHGDLLDLIQLHHGHRTLAEAISEARAFLALPRQSPSARQNGTRRPSRSDSALRLWTESVPLQGTLAERYLGQRGLGSAVSGTSLRFHGACPFGDSANLLRLPALIAAVRDADGRVVGIHRTALDPVSGGKAGIAAPRRALGTIHGHGVRFGPDSADTCIVGEGLETTLSVSLCLPHLAAIATLSAGHMGAVILPPSLRLLCIALDNDTAGRKAAHRLRDRTREQKIDVILLRPRLGDFNDDLLTYGGEALQRALTVQFAGLLECPQPA